MGPIGSQPGNPPIPITKVRTMTADGPEHLFGNTLYYGDNLDVLRAHVPDESVDLIYLDPPFNSQRSYNVLFRDRSGDEGSAQAHAFDDTWRWGSEAERTYHELIHGDHAKVADTIEALRSLLGESDMLAYLVMMAPRILELHRVLSPTGSLYLHCDPTASHYLRLLLDSIMGPVNFRNEIVWQRTTSKGLSSRRHSNNHDILLCYQKTAEATFNPDAAFIPYDPDNLDPKTAAKYSAVDQDGRRYRLDNLINPNPDRPNLTYEFLGVTRVWRWTRERMQRAYDDGLVVQTAPGRVPSLKRYLDEQRGKPMGDVWTDIPPLNSQAAERLGYPTQKPLALIERIIQASSNPGDVVLDPFCGCGTTVDAAQKLGRRWIGIDVSYLAVDVIDKRLRAQHGDSIAATYEIKGRPVDVEGAQALADRDKFEFERWAVSLLNGTPNATQTGDRGVDGTIRFATGRKTYGKILISVKGGQVNPGFVRDLAGTVQGHRAAMGILVSMRTPTKGMVEAAAAAGLYEQAGRTYPRVQVIGVADLLAGITPQLPPTFMPYVSQDRLVEERIDPLPQQPKAQHREVS